MTEELKPCPYCGNELISMGWTYSTRGYAGRRLVCGGRMICRVTINCPECGCKNTANLDDRELTIEYRCKECGSERTMQLRDLGTLRNIMEE